MTEAEWMGCEKPGVMLEFLKGKASDRKMRLFACACCRRMWHWLIDHRSREAVEVGERFADREATDQERETARGLAAEADRHIAVAAGCYRPTFGTEADRLFVVDDLAANAVGPTGAVLSTVEPNDDEGDISGVIVCGTRDCDPAAEDVIHRMLLRDIFGNPFRPATFDPSWLRWNGGTISTLAKAVYEERELPSGHLDPVRLALLADMLEDAGCADGAILDHLRGPGPHVRGCWAVDVVLGKG